MPTPNGASFVDGSSHSAVAVCRCGARMLGLDRLDARRQLATHEARQHPADEVNRDALRKLLARAS